MLSINNFILFKLDVEINDVTISLKTKHILAIVI